MTTAQLLYILIRLQYAEVVKWDCAVKVESESDRAPAGGGGTTPEAPSPLRTALVRLKV